MYLIHEKVSLKVALDDDGDVDDDRILYWVIWSKLLKNLQEFILYQFHTFEFSVHLGEIIIIHLSVGKSILNYGILRFIIIY